MSCQKMEQCVSSTRGRASPLLKQYGWFSLCQIFFPRSNVRMKMVIPTSQKDFVLNENEFRLCFFVTNGDPACWDGEYAEERCCANDGDSA